MIGFSVQPDLSTAQVCPDDEKLVTVQVQENEETHGKA
jgi:hypothetical protein